MPAASKSQSPCSITNRIYAQAKTTICFPLENYNMWSWFPARTNLFLLAKQTSIGTWRNSNLISNKTSILRTPSKASYLHQSMTNQNELPPKNWVKRCGIRHIDSSDSMFYTYKTQCYFGSCLKLFQDFYNLLTWTSGLSLLFKHFS